MKNALRLLPLALAALASVATSAPNTTPEPEVCSNPPGGITVESIAIGHPYEADFSPFVDGDSYYFETGPQGSPMVVIRLMVTGDDAPACLAQTTEVRSASGEVIAEEVRPIATREIAPGVRMTDEIFLPVFYVPPSGETFTVTVSAAGQSVTLMLLAE